MGWASEDATFYGSLPLTQISHQTSQIKTLGSYKCLDSKRTSIMILNHWKHVRLFRDQPEEYEALKCQANSAQARTPKCMNNKIMLSYRHILSWQRCRSSTIHIYRKQNNRCTREKLERSVTISRLGIGTHIDSNRGLENKYVHQKTTNNANANCKILQNIIQPRNTNRHHNAPKDLK